MRVDIEEVICCEAVDVCASSDSNYGNPVMATIATSTNSLGHYTKDDWAPNHELVVDDRQ